MNYAYIKSVFTDFDVNSNKPTETSYVFQQNPSSNVIKAITEHNNSNTLLKDSEYAYAQNLVNSKNDILSANNTSKSVARETFQNSDSNCDNALKHILSCQYCRNILISNLLKQQMYQNQYPNQFQYQIPNQYFYRNPYNNYYDNSFNYDIFAFILLGVIVLFILNKYFK